MNSFCTKEYGLSVNTHDGTFFIKQDKLSNSFNGRIWLDLEGAKFLAQKLEEFIEQNT